MKKIYYLLVCLFFLQSAFAAGEKQSFDVCLQNGLNMNVEVCTDGIFRIRVTPRSTFSESLMQRYGIIKTDWDPVPVSPKDNKQQFEVSTGAYRLKVDKKTGAISVSDRKGRVIIEKVVFLTSADPLCIELGEVINAKYKDMKVPNNGTIIGDDKNPGNMKDQAETGDYKNTSILSISLKDGERFYGGGSTSRDHIQHRGELLRMWTTYQHTEIPMPFMISSENWGIFNNTTRKNFFDIGNYQSDVFSIYNTTDEVDFYLMFGNSMPDVINYYTAIIGRPYLLPKYAYGLCFGPNMLEDQFDILCKKCAIEAACPNKVAKVVDGKIQIDKNICKNCGRCVGKCPFHTIEDGAYGYKIYIGGRWGKKVSQGKALGRIFTSKEEALDVIEKAILFFRDNGIKGERFAETIERIGFENVEKQLLEQL